MHEQAHTHTQVVMHTDTCKHAGTTTEQAPHLPQRHSNLLERWCCPAPCPPPRPRCSLCHPTNLPVQLPQATGSRPDHQHQPGTQPQSCTSLELLRLLDGETGTGVPPVRTHGRPGTKRFQGLAALLHPGFHRMWADHDRLLCGPGWTR